MRSAAAIGSFRLPTLKSVYEFDSYGGVVIVILVTYVLSINLSKSWGLSVILVVQIATVSIILRISRAPHLIRVVAAVSLLVAVAAAIVGLFLHRDVADKFLPAVSGLLYLIAPVSILRHLIQRTVVDQETVLGAVVGLSPGRDVLCVRLSCRRRQRGNGVLRRPGRRDLCPGPVLLVHDAHDDGIRKPRPGGEPGPELRPCGDADRPTVPGDRCGQGHQLVPTGEEARTGCRGVGLSGWRASS